MLMVLPTQFNVNPPLFFSLLGRSFPSPFPYTAAGGTGSRSTPPSGFGESTQDKKKKKREKEEQEECLMVRGPVDTD